MQRFYYEVEHAYLSPALYTDQKGDKFILPTMQKVHPKTTLEDIKLTRPKLEKRTEPIIETSISSSGDVTYETKYYPDSGNYYCSCPGTWRAKDRRCKHIKALELKNEVITTPFSFIATSSSIKWNGLDPVFSDIDESIGNMILESVEKKLSNDSSEQSFQKAGQ